MQPAAAVDGRRLSVFDDVPHVDDTLGLFTHVPKSAVKAMWAASPNALSCDRRPRDRLGEDCRSDACGPDGRGTLDTIVSAMSAPQRAGGKRRRFGIDATDSFDHGARAGASLRELHSLGHAGPHNPPVPSGVARRQARRPRVRWTDEETDELIRLQALYEGRSRPGASCAGRSQNRRLA